MGDSEPDSLVQNLAGGELENVVLVVIELETSAEPEVALSGAVFGVGGSGLWKTFDVGGVVALDVLDNIGTAGRK